MHARVGNQAQDAAVTGHLLYAHLHARVHRAHENVYLVTLHQAAGVFNAFGGLGLVVHFEPFNLAATELAALFVQGHAKGVFNGHTQGRKRAGVGQHEADAHFVALRANNLGQQQASGSGTDDGSAAGQDESTGGHMKSPIDECCGLIISERCAA